MNFRIIGGKADLDKTKRTILLLRILLLAGAFGWGISILGVFMPWHAVVTQLEGLGTQNISSDPMLNYWLRMTSGAFAFIGLLFLICAFNLRKYFILLPLLGFFMIAEGLILLTFGLVLKLNILPFIVDVTFCILIGIGILIAGHLSKASFD
jgi:hypothetical protein